MKQCAVCKKLKPIDSFSGRGSYCRPCQAAFNKRWRIENAGDVKAKQAWAFQQLTPRARWERHLRVRYGIAVADYERILAVQRSVCAICEQPSVRKRLSVDHCHKTGAVRGLLCERCNSVLGRVDDSREILLSAAEYLGQKVQLSIAK